MATYSSSLAWRIQYSCHGSLVGCHLWGLTESDTTDVTQQQQQPMTSTKALLSSYRRKGHCNQAAMETQSQDALLCTTYSTLWLVKSVGLLFCLNPGCPVSLSRPMPLYLRHAICMYVVFVIYIYRYIFIYFTYIFVIFLKYS